MSRTLYLVGLTSRLWEEFSELHKQAGSLPMNVVPPEVAFIADSYDQATQNLVAGAIVYHSDGPWLMVENLVANPKFPISVRYQAIDIILSSVRAAAAMAGHWVLACPSKKGLFRFLMKRGFTAPRAAIVVSRPGLPFPVVDRPKRFSKAPIARTIRHPRRQKPTK